MLKLFSRPHCTLESPLAGSISETFFAAGLKDADLSKLLSEYITVDGTLPEGWATQNGLRRVRDDQQPTASASGP